MTLTNAAGAEQGADRRLLSKAMRSAGRLPPFSPVLNKLLASLADEDVSFAEVAELIEKDTVLAGNVLRLVNSALYGRRGTINSVRHAVSLMGLAKVRNAAMSLSVGRMWQKLDVHAKWVPSHFNLHGVASALMADQIAAELVVDYAEGAFAAGLLHEVGLLLMAIGVKDEYGQLMRVYTESKHPLVECEMTLFGFPHTELSAEVLRLWHLPLPIQMAVRQGLALPEGPINNLGSIVALSDELVGQLQIRVQPWIRPYEGQATETLDRVGLGARSEAILTSFATEVDTIKPFFY